MMEYRDKKKKSDKQFKAVAKAKVRVERSDGTVERYDATTENKAKN